MVGLGALFAVNAAGHRRCRSTMSPHSGTWDFSPPVSGEAKVFDQLVDPSGQWWAADFPTRDLRRALDDGQQALRRLPRQRRQARAARRRQRAERAQQTELTYATPIVVLQFPLVGRRPPGPRSRDVSGTRPAASPSSRHEKYVFTVDERGTTKVPAAQLRHPAPARSTTPRPTASLVTTRITYLHLAECYGAVARVRSKDNETVGRLHPGGRVPAARQSMSRAADALAPDASLWCDCIMAWCACIMPLASCRRLRPLPDRRLRAAAGGGARRRRRARPAARHRRNPTGARETVLLVHGYGSSTASYAPVMDALAAHFRVLAVDLPGFGKSDRREGDYSPDALADVLADDARRKRASPRAHVVGHSWGSSVVLAFARRHPDRLDKLVVISGWIYDEQLLPIMRWARVPRPRRGALRRLLPQGHRRAALPQLRRSRRWSRRRWSTRWRSRWRATARSRRRSPRRAA